MKFKKHLILAIAFSYWSAILETWNCFACAPVADFYAPTSRVCIGDTLQFTDYSTLGITSWLWSFPGGTPSSSTLQNPSVVYNTPGTFNVSLSVSKGGLYNTKVKPGLTVAPPPSCLSYPSLPSLNWVSSTGNNTSGETSTSIALDLQGNAYITGYFQGTVDFDPGPGTYNLTSAAADIFVAKYNSAGVFQWAFKIGGSEYDMGSGIATDSSGNIYITGTFESTVDFDPGAGTANLISSLPSFWYATFVAKYDSAGAYQWAIGIETGAGYQFEKREIAIDKNSNVLVVGTFGGGDFNPGAGTAYLSNNGMQDMFVAKYNSSGVFQWAKSHGADVSDIGYSVATDDLCNVYIGGAGATDSMIIAKYDSSGLFQWSFKAFNSVCQGIAADGNGDVYITGHYNGRIDFDPDTGTAYLFPYNNGGYSGGRDIFVAKYNTYGKYQWAWSAGLTENAVTQFFGGEDIAINCSGDIFVSGRINSDTGDFDPGPGIINMVGDFAPYPHFIAKYNSSGAYQWSTVLGGTIGFDGLAVSGCCDLYMTGTFSGTKDFDLGPGISNLTSVAGLDIFVAKYSDSIPVNFSLINICQGDSIFLSGTYQTTGGIYYDTLYNINGCDSIIGTALAVDSYFFSTVPISLCMGDSVQLPGGNWANTTGIYYDTLTAIAGCDSIIQTTLSVNTSYNIPLTASICNGDSVFLQGNYQTAAGTYYDTLTSVNGCDSIFATTLSVDSAIFNTVAASLCPGDSVQLPGGNWVNSTGVYSDTLTASAGCDSIIQTNISLNSIYNIPFSTSICSGDSIFLQGNYQTTAGTYYDTLSTLNGCDSILATTLSVNNNITIPLTANICSGDSIFLGGNWQNNSGTFYDTLTSVNGCDSILATTLSVPAAITLTMNSSDASCGNTDGSASVTASGGVTPYTYQWDGPVPPYGGTSGGWNSADSLLAGTYTVTVTDSNSCEQTATINISNAGPPDATISSIINVTCNGGNDGSATVSATGGALPYSYLWSPMGGADSTATGLPAGTYTVTITDNAGCIEITDTIISEPPLIQNSTTTNICTGDSIFLSGSWQTTAGTYYDTLSAIGGCDSILTTTLSVNNNITIPLTASICTGDSIFLQGNYQTAAGTYYDTLTSANSCDSILATTLTVDSAIFNSLTTSICPGDSIQLPDGNWANSAGVYYDTLTAGAGCDSIVQIILSVNTSYNIPLTASICSGDSIFLQGNYQTTAGTYYDTLTTINGCDSILATTLSVDSAIFNSVATSLCPGDSIQLPDGNWVNSAGVYYDTLTAGAGCDSIIQTTLSVNTSYNIPLTAAICSGDSIFLQGNYQSTNGTYYDTLVSVNGCDSIKATTLTVNPVSSIQYPVSICNGDSIFLQNAWQTNAGTYNDTLVASSGCDSVVTATLAVNLTATTTATATLCQGDSVLIAGIWVKGTGTYYDSLLTASGCDSIIAINLSIDSIPVVTVGQDTTITAGASIQIVASGGISYQWSNGETSPGITVSPQESTTYYVTVSDDNGCAVTDSVKISVDISKCTVFVPTIFTPNGDGKNDVLYVRGYGLKEIEFMIYDRWGEKVFEYNGAPPPQAGAGGGPGWDGTFQKKELNTAVFVYMLKAVCFNGELIEEKGNITLVK